MVLQLTPFSSSSTAKKDRIFALCHDDIKFANGLNSLVPELIMTTLFLTSRVYLKFEAVL